MTKRGRYYVASIIGNVLEWYDFVLYGMFATVFAKLFFPANDAKIALIGSLGVFAVGYLMRPIGGICIGHFGDTYSRKRALMFSLALMGIATTLIGLLPTYQQIGIMAPICLVVLRLLQGFAVGGEFPGSLLVLRDLAVARFPALATSIAVISAMFGFLIGSGLATVLTHTMHHDSFMAWGWRVPFFFSSVLAVIGLYLRMKLMQDDAFKKQRRVPVLQLFHHYKRNLLVAMSQVFFIAVFSAVGSAFLATYLVHYLHFALNNVFLLLFIGTIIQMIFLPFSAYITDRLNNHIAWSKGGCIIIFIVIWPLFWLMKQGGVETVVAVMLLMVIFGIYGGQTIYIIVEAFPVPVRYSGVALSHGLTMSLTVGLMPLLLNSLLPRLGMVAPAYAFMLAAVLAFWGLKNFKK